MCEEGDCANEQFTGAFRTEIDLKAHIATHHSKNKSKAEARQARMLELEFTYAPHNRSNGNFFFFLILYQVFFRLNIRCNENLPMRK